MTSDTRVAQRAVTSTNYINGSARKGVSACDYSPEAHTYSLGLAQVRVTSPIKREVVGSNPTSGEIPCGSVVERLMYLGRLSHPFLSVYLRMALVGDTSTENWKNLPGRLFLRA